MNKERKAQEKEVRVRQPLTARRVGDLLLNNALIIIMVIAVIYIAIRNPNFIKPASLINIFSQTAAYCNTKAPQHYAVSAVLGSSCFQRF